MAKHASGKNNYTLSGGAIAFLVVLALLLAGAVWWVTRPGGEDLEAAERECVAGELTLPIAAADEAVGQLLIDAYGDTQPVVRDYCVEPELVHEVAHAAVYVAPNTAVSRQVLDNAGRSQAVSDPQAVFGEPVGVAGKDAVALTDLGAEKVRFPVGDDPVASALVAAQVSGNDNDAVRALTDQRIGGVDDFDADSGLYLATSEHGVPDGMQFTPVGADAVYVAFPLNQNDRVDENQARAGQDFARFAADAFEGSPADQPAVSDLVWAAALPAGGEAITADAKRESASQDNAAGDEEAEARAPENTLFLLDTSDAMAPYIQPAKDAIADAALELGARGKQVGLWNYSSPLTPGITVGYRENITVSPDAESVAVAVRRFLTGGVPQTRQAVEAAAAAYGGWDTTTRVVVVTTGTADRGDDAAFERAVRQAAGERVQIAVVHVGEGERDTALDAVAARTADAQQADAIAGALNEVAGL